LVNVAPVHEWPGSASPQAITQWWTTTGTNSAAITMVWALGIIVGAYLTLVGAMALITAVGSLTGHFRWTRSLWRITPAGGARRLLMVGAVLTLSAGPVAASGDASPVMPIVLVDLGPTPSGQATPTPVAIEAQPSTPNTSSTRSDVWVVQPGDHLWHIAEQTIEDHADMAPKVGTITRYWKRLIAENFPLGTNPDLIIPGQTIVLPPL